MRCNGSVCRRQKGEKVDNFLDQKIDKFYYVKIVYCSVGLKEEKTL